MFKSKLLSLKSKKSAGFSFLLVMCVSVMGNAVYDHLVSPAFSLLPYAPVVAYNLLVTSIILIFMVGLVVAPVHGLFQGWKHLTKRESRTNLIENIRSWRASKLDWLWIVAAIYMATLIFLMSMLMLVIPKEQIAEVVSPEQAQTIVVVSMMPFVLLMLAWFIGSAIQKYPDMRHQWGIRTYKEKAKEVSVAAFVLLAYGVLVLGNHAGWDHLLWFNVA